jgi:hypothetical protein
MMNFILGLVLLAFVAICVALILGFIRHIWRLDRVNRSVVGMESGLFVEHGHIFNKKTGRLEPQKKPAAAAYRSIPSS